MNSDFHSLISDPDHEFARRFLRFQARQNFTTEIPLACFSASESMANRTVGTPSFAALCSFFVLEASNVYGWGIAGRTSLKTVLKTVKKTVIPLLALASGSVVVRLQASMVAVASPNLQTFAVFLGDDVDRAIVSVRLEIGGLISNEVAAADHIAQLIKRLAQS